jgi:hypothetical protein
MTCQTIDFFTLVFIRDVLAAGGVDYALRHHEKSEDKKHPGKNHDHKVRDAALAGGVGLALHEHDKHKRENALKEEENRRKAASTAAVRPVQQPAANHTTAVPTTAAGTNAATANGRYQPSNSHARSLKAKGRMDSFFGGLFCSHNMKMKGIERQQAANREYQQVAHMREAERLHKQANAHARAAGVA